MKKQALQSTPFRTAVAIPNYPIEITYRTNIFSIGSCFAQEMAERMDERKLRVRVNPMGIQYNPRSILQALERLLEGEGVVDSDLYFDGDLWHAWFFHGQFSGIDRGRVLASLNASIEVAHAYMSAADVVLITFGTARYYTLKETGEVVSNCHKAPASMFEQHLIEPEETRDDFVRLLDKWRAIRPELKVILTISPVRHLRDGLMANFKSKSRLNVLVQELVNQRPEIYYFPAYEILVDELRDYRYYAEDMAHPSEMAVDYIWELFKGALLSEEALKLMEKIERLRRDVLHRPLHPDSPAHRIFMEGLAKRLEAFEREEGWALRWDG